MPDRFGEPQDLDGPTARALAIVACGLCDDNGYRGVVVCDHVDRRESNRRGVEKCRQALRKKTS
jgi:hypothetical protein